MENHEKQDDRKPLDGDDEVVADIEVGEEDLDAVGGGASSTGRAQTGTPQIGMPALD